MDLPLSGLVAIEIGSSVAAPFAGQILADLGARVIKVEQPGSGDDARTWGPPFWHGASATFQTLNRNKLSVTVDFKDVNQLGEEMLAQELAKPPGKQDKRLIHELTEILYWDASGKKPQTLRDPESKENSFVPKTSGPATKKQ